MFLLFFLCLAAEGHVINKELLTPWDPAITPYRTEPLPPIPHEETMLQDYMKSVHELQHQYELKNKQLEFEHNTHVNPLTHMKNDIQLAFDEEATTLIKKLTSALRTLNKNIVKQNSVAQTQFRNKVYMIKIPDTTNNRHARNKRDTNKVEDVESNNNTAPTTEAVITEVKNETVDNKDNKTNETDNSTDFAPPEANCNQTLNTRRNFNEDLEVSNAVKARLLSYIKEYFNDIETKINSLRNVKKAFASDNEYNIGYMIANIDMLEVNLRNLKAEMERNRHELGEKHILDMFDKVKVSNNLVTSLISALKTILERKAVKPAGPPADRFYPANPHYK